MSSVQPKHTIPRWIEDCKDIKIKWVKWVVSPAHLAYLSRCKVGILEEFHVSLRKYTCISASMKSHTHQWFTYSKEWHMWNHNAKWQILGVRYTNKPAAVPREIQQRGTPMSGLIFLEQVSHDDAMIRRNQPWTKPG
jgi:hypothetical protein